MAQLIDVENGIEFRNITHEEMRIVYELESRNFTEDEADTYETFVNRQREAPDLQLGCYIDGSLVGFISAARYHGKEITKESMTMHEPGGESVCIHSVVIQENHRRKGFGLRMMQVFLEKVEKEQYGVSRILTICKFDRIPFYRRAGFVSNGKSSIVHGHDPRYELQISILDK